MKPSKKAGKEPIICAGCAKVVGPNRAAKMTAAYSFCPPCRDKLFRPGPLRRKFADLMG